MFKGKEEVVIKNKNKFDKNLAQKKKNNKIAYRLKKIQRKTSYWVTILDIQRSRSISIKYTNSRQTVLQNHNKKNRKKEKKPPKKEKKE